MKKLTLRSVLYTGVLRVTGRRPQIEFLDQLRFLQFDTREDTEQHHKARLGAILRFACEHVPYYREIFQDLKLSVAEVIVNPMGALNSLPLLDKKILRTSFAELHSDDLSNRRWHYNTSGGSTGEPARFAQDDEYHHSGMGGKNIFDEWSGFQLGNPKVLLWGSERDLLVGKETWRSRLGRWLRREYPLNTFRMSSADMRHFVETINRVRPVQILSYTESAFELARYIERDNLRVYSPRAVMTSAGTLYPHMRETIERVFAAPVFNRYGSREVGDVACECERHRGLHVNPYTHHLEILRPDGTPCQPGEVGEIAMTLLTNRAMPLLRYRIGDLAAWAEESCDCGRHWPLLKEVSGRVMDVFRRADGSPIMPEYFIHFIGVTRRSELDFIEKFQLIQEDLQHLRLLLVPNIEADIAKLLVVEKKPLLDKLVRTVMGDDCHLEVKLVNEIPKTPTGKYRYTISMIDPNDETAN